LQLAWVVTMFGGGADLEATSDLESRIYLNHDNNLSTLLY